VLGKLGRLARGIIARTGSSRKAEASNGARLSHRARHGLFIPQTPGRRKTRRGAGDEGSAWSRGRFPQSQRDSAISLGLRAARYPWFSPIKRSTPTGLCLTAATSPDATPVGLDRGADAPPG